MGNPTQCARIRSRWRVHPTSLEARKANQDATMSGSTEARCAEARRVEATGPKWEASAAVTTLGAKRGESSRWRRWEAGERIAARVSSMAVAAVATEWGWRVGGAMKGKR
uniref:DUF834 domain-containing protein n=1 Tax=Oryza rufipogon TaxID=4529 RepID=A0A0E0P3V3_ORYRU